MAPDPPCGPQPSAPVTPGWAQTCGLWPPPALTGRLDLRWGFPEGLTESPAACKAAILDLMLETWGTKDMHIILMCQPNVPAQVEQLLIH